MTKLLFLFFIVMLVFVIVERFLRSVQKGEPITVRSIKTSFRQSGKSIWQGLQLFVVIWVIYLIVSLWLRSRNS